MSGREGEGFRVALGEMHIAGPISRPAISASAKRARAYLLRLLREPLVHFIVVGALLFAAGQIYRSETSSYRIVLTQRHIEQLKHDYALQFGTAPDPRTLDALIRRDIHDEILYREGLSLKLDQDDMIVRRRVVQKMAFLLQDLHPPPEPTTAELAGYYRAHLDRYAIPPRVTFTHVYFSLDGRADAQARARAVLAKLGDVTRAPDRGDSFPDLYDFSSYEPEQVYRVFGHTPLAAAVYSVPLGHWAGPFRSGYGWHLIYVSVRQGPSHPPLQQVREQVRTDYLQDAQDAANARAFGELVKRYTIVRDGGQSGP